MPENDQKHDYVWIEKVTYGSALLRRVYRLTATNMTTEKGHWDREAMASFTASKQYSTNLRPMLNKMPFFERALLDHIDLAFVEASRLAERLEGIRNRLFPCDELPLTSDGYISFIPVIWTICNQQRNHALASSTVWEMCQLSMLNYQMDEYIETVVQGLSNPELLRLCSDVDKFCGQEHSSNFSFPHPLNGTQEQGQTISHYDSQHLEQETTRPRAALIIGTYIAHVLQHTLVLRLSKMDQHSFARSVRNFIYSHMVQNLNSRIHCDAQKGKESGK